MSPKIKLICTLSDGRETSGEYDYQEAIYRQGHALMQKGCVSAVLIDSADIA